MISPKTALVSALLKASSCNSVEDFTGEPDTNHSGLIAFALRFEVILLFAALDLRSFGLLHATLRSLVLRTAPQRLFTRAGVLALSAPLWGLLLQ